MLSSMPIALSACSALHAQWYEVCDLCMMVSPITMQTIHIAWSLIVLIILYVTLSSKMKDRPSTILII
jgi:hypothetical protein